MENPDSTLRLLMLVISGVFGLSWLSLSFAFRLIPRAALSFFVANVLLGSGVILMLERLGHPGFMSFQVADWLVIGGLVSFHSGILQLLRDSPPSLWVRYTPLWIEIAATAALAPDTSSYVFRALAFNAVASVTTCSGFIECVWRDKVRRFKGWVRVLIAWPFLGAGLLFGARAGQILANSVTAGTTPEDSTLRFTMFLWTFIVLLVVTNISIAGLLVSSMQKKERELLAELDQANAKLAKQLQLRTEQLQHTDQTLSQIRADYERDYPMAMMAAVVPSITHDLNTAIGCSFMVASTMDDSYAKFDRLHESDTVRKSDLDNFKKSVREGLTLIESTNERTAELVSSLKQLAIDQVTQQRRSFRVDELIQNVVGTLKPALRSGKVTVVYELAKGLIMDSYPGPLGQVIVNLIQNALIHAFDGISDRTVTLRAHVINESQVRIEVQDSGKGMNEDVLAHLFQAFYTTRRGEGGSGIGLAFSKSLIEKVLSGKIIAESKSGEGSRFTIELPIKTPTNSSPA